MDENKSGKGLKSLRSNSHDKVPTHECSNCKCKRFSPCTCTKNDGSTRKSRRDVRMAEYAESLKTKKVAKRAKKSSK